MSSTDPAELHEQIRNMEGHLHELKLKVADARAALKKEKRGTPEHERRQDQLDREIEARNDLSHQIKLYQKELRNLFPK